MHRIQSAFVEFLNQRMADLSMTKEDLLEALKPQDVYFTEITVNMLFLAQSPFPGEVPLRHLARVILVNPDQLVPFCWIADRPAPETLQLPNNLKKALENHPTSKPILQVLLKIYKASNQDFSPELWMEIVTALSE